MFEVLEQEWRETRKRYEWSVGPFVVMPDHVHFFMSPDVETCIPLNQPVRRWKEWTSKRVLKAIGQDAPLWQENYFDHLLRSDEAWSEKFQYVRNNPVRAGLVQDASAWPFQGWIDFETR